MKLGILWVGGQNFSEAKFCISAPAPRGTTQGRSQDFRSGGGDTQKKLPGRERWPPRAVKERRSLTGELSLSYARPTADR